MTYIKLNYYSHLLLNSKYSLLIKVVIIFSIYALFYIDSSTDIAYCTQSSEKKLKKALEEIERLKLENEYLKKQSNDIIFYQTAQLVGDETLNTLKNKIEEFRLKNAPNFLTIEEQEATTIVRNTGVRRSDIILKPDLYISKYQNITSNYINPYLSGNFGIARMETDSTGKQFAELVRDFRINGTDLDGYTNIISTKSPYFYDFREYYNEVYYPPNHPDNNFNPEGKRLLKIIERKFYNKQIINTIIENCIIS